MRSKVLQKRAELKKPLELDITSLLDILVILLVFLLKTYNPEDTILKLVDNLKLPFSESRATREEVVTLQIDRNRVMWLREMKIGVLKKSMEGDRIKSLSSALDKIRKERTRGPASKNDKMRGKINIVMDKDLPYSVLKNIMYTSGLSGFDKFKFVIQSNEDF